MKYKAIIFDFDDTLVESRLKKWAQHKLVAKKFYDIDLTDEDLRKHWGKPFDKLLSLLYKNSDTPENMRAAIKSVHDDFLKDAYEHSVYVVNKIFESGAEVGVLSAANREHLEDELTRIGLPIERFFALQGADETTVHKPDPEVFTPMIEKLAEKGIGRSGILYVGDSLDDFRSSRDAGIHFIAVTTGLYSKEEFAKDGAKIILSDIKELMKYIFDDLV